MNVAEQINQNCIEGAETGRRYAVIDYSTRVNLIKRVINDDWTVAQACRKYNINMTTGCLIVRNYRETGHIFQKPGKGGPTDDLILDVVPQKKLKSQSRKGRDQKKIKKIEPSLVQTNKTIPSEPQIKVENLENMEIRYLESAPAASLIPTQTPFFFPSVIQLSYPVCYIPDWNIYWP